MHRAYAIGLRERSRLKRGAHSSRTHSLAQIMGSDGEDLMTERAGA